MSKRLRLRAMRGVAASTLKADMAARLRAAREALGLKSGEVARQLGRPESTYSRYETGVTPIPVKVIADLDIFFRITPSYIVRGSVTDLSQELRDALDRRQRKKRLKTSADSSPQSRG